MSSSIEDKSLLFSSGVAQDEKLLQEQSAIEKNRVVIRIWTSGFNGGEDVGHISIQTKRNMSLWPKGRPGGKIRQFFEIRQPDFVSNPEKDIKLEGRPPELTVCLYSLNPERIEDKFDELKAALEKENVEGNLVGWTLFGSNTLLNDNAAESCASFGLKLLQAGGFDLEHSSFSSSVSPDAMAAVVIKAKKKELEDHPETAKLKFPGETLIEDLNRHNKKGNCVIL